MVRLCQNERTAVRARDGNHFEGTSVLVVDDEPGIVEVLCAVLQDVRCRVVGAADGEEALAQLRSSVPDLVVLDLEMPVLDGAQTLRVIRKDPRWAALPVILMSGLPESTAKRRSQGYNAFLRKPFALDELLETMGPMIESPRVREPAPKKAKARKRSSPR
jgi:CheY-like chemotaxis protein